MPESPAEYVKRVMGTGQPAAPAQDLPLYKPITTAPRDGSYVRVLIHARHQARRAGKDVLIEYVREFSEPLRWGHPSIPEISAGWWHRSFEPVGEVCRCMADGIGDWNDGSVALGWRAV